MGIKRTAAALAMLLLAGCGTTVDSTRTTTPTGPVNPIAASASTAKNGATPQSAVPAATGAGDANGAATSGGGAPLVPGAGSGPGRPATSAPVRGYGYDATHVYVGVGTSNDTSSYAKSLGFNVNVGDAKGQAQAVISYLNKHGGLAGRQIVPVWHDVSDANYNSDPSGTAQAECADWTQDHHVFAAVNALSYPDNAIACLAQAHTIAITSAPAGPVVSATLAKFSPYFYAPGMADTGHLVGPFIDELVREGYFTGWDTTNGSPGHAPVKIAVLYAADRPDLLQLTQKALARNHLTVSDSFYLGSTTDDGQLAGAVLKFKSEGITHVLTYGFLSVLPRIADSQHYRPRYGVSSWDGFALSTSSAPAQQLVGALGVGWTPLEDVDAAHDPGESRAEKQCLAIMRAAGQDTSDRGTASAMASVCEQLFLLQAAIARAGQLSPLAVATGVEAIGDSFGSALTFGERFAPGRHAGVAAFRPVRYNASCSCFAYTGAVRRFP